MKMYRLCVPILDYGRSEKDLEQLIKELCRAKTDTVFLVFDRVLDNREMLDEKIRKFTETKNYIEERGFNVSAWVAPSVGYGGRCSVDNDASNKYTRIVTDRGRILDGGFCPLDENFVDDFLNTVRTLAKTGVMEIMFEDDYTLTGGKMFHEHGCCCETHMLLLRERLGEKITREELSEKLYASDGKGYRHEFLKLMGETLGEFTKKLEKCIHEVNPEIRIGLSANASSYRMEGIGMSELSRKTAGNTRPFIRMTGAPYWDQVPTFAANIEAIRVQTYWLKDSGAELITEGDVYPRPRHWVPAAYLEGYDMILRADGKSHGILKYMTDYTSKADYETGYIDRHVKNAPHYEEIERRFSGKEAVGLNIIESLSVFEDADFGEDITREGYHDYGGFQPLISQWFAVDNSVPTCYGRTDCASLVFGENARHVDENALKNGIITDMLGAKILMRRGIDVGIKAYEKTYPMVVEHYTYEDDFTVATCNRDAIFYDVTVNEKAEIMSSFLKIKGDFGNYSEHLWKTAERCPACYFYENESGHRFLVYSFVAETAWGKGIWTKGVFRSYYRQAQLYRGIEKLQGKPLPAMCFKSPELYILCKKDEGSMAVGLWNFFADGVLNPEIVLDGEYKSVDFYNCSGKLEGNKVILDDEIMPYGFALFTVYE